MRREEHGAGHDERVLVLLANLLPVGGVREQPLVRFEILLLFDLLRQQQRRAGWMLLALTVAVGAAGCGVTRSVEVATRHPRLILCDVHERQDVCVDDSQRRLGAKLAAEQTNRFLVRIDILGAAGHEAGHEHALKWRNVQLWLNGCFDRDFVVVGPARRNPHRGDDGGGEREPTASLCLNRSDH